LHRYAEGEAGTGNVVEAVRHCRAVMGDIRRLCAMSEDEIYVYAKEIRAPLVRSGLSSCRIPFNRPDAQRLNAPGVWFLNPYTKKVKKPSKTRPAGFIKPLLITNSNVRYVVPPYLEELVRQTKTLGRLPVVNFAAGGVATPADAALMMQLGMGRGAVCSFE
jgi:pyridoxal 5'-phosphate synthase pdxS subunit